MRTGVNSSRAKRVSDPGDEIAVIGMSGRFPGAPDPAALWRLLREGREAVAEAPADRGWLHDLHGPVRSPGKVASNRLGALSGIEMFDAGFFGLSPREAHRMDPQIRALLETAYEAMENAGVPPDLAATETVGVFVGSAYSDYWTRQLGDLDGLDMYSEVGNSRAFLSGRLSYVFDLRGPSITLDTACSSSLAAVHLACQSLRMGESDLALAGGSNLILAPYNTITFSSAGAHSGDGRCKFGDTRADGYVRGDAVGLVLLKPLARAVADGDRIRAVILGSASTNNGFTGLGIVAPSLSRQEQTLRAAYADAGIDPRAVHFVEAHGTGTVAGDAAELGALATVLAGRPAGAPPVPVGSAKSNLGHTEGAAGITGLIKTILCLENRTVPPSLHVRELNTSIDWSTAPITIPVTNTPLPSGDDPIIAGVNGFGAAGSNVHLVVSSAPPPAPLGTGPAAGRTEVLTLSARTEQALRELAGTYRGVLTESRLADQEVAGLCAGAARGRQHWEYRLAVTAESAEHMAKDLSAFIEGGSTVRTHSTAKDSDTAPRTVFVVPGQGSQWPAMGRELLADCEPFRAALQACDEVLIDRIGWSVRSAIEGDDPTWTSSTRLVQPALWAMAIALTRTWQAWGITPDAVLGQSQGEIAAAHIAGALTLEQSGLLVCTRAELATELCPPGAMARVELPVDQIPALLAESQSHAQIAVHNSPSSTVLAGSRQEIERIERSCELRRIDCQRISVDYAAHSSMVDPVREPLLHRLNPFRPTATTVPMWSTVTGAPIRGDELDLDYWWRNLREPVLLAPTLRAVLEAGAATFIQVSPHPLLTAAIEETATECGGRATALASLRRGRPERATLLDTLAVLYAQGRQLNWAEIYADTARAFELPRYPWQRGEFWHQSANCPWPPFGARSHSADPPKDVMASTSTPATAPTREAAVTESASNGAERPRIRLDQHRHRFLLDHQVDGHPVLPGAALIDLLLGAAESAAQEIVLGDIRFTAMLPITAETLAATEFRVTLGADAARRFEVSSRNGSDDWTIHARSASTRNPVRQWAIRPASNRPGGGARGGRPVRSSIVIMPGGEMTGAVRSAESRRYGQVRTRRSPRSGRFPPTDSVSIRPRWTPAYKAPSRSSPNLSPAPACCWPESTASGSRAGR